MMVPKINLTKEMEVQTEVRDPLLPKNKVLENIEALLEI